MKEYLIAGAAGILIVGSQTAVAAFSNPMETVVEASAEETAVSTSVRDAGVVRAGREAGPMVTGNVAVVPVAPVAMRNPVPDRLAENPAAGAGGYNTAISSVTMQGTPIDGKMNWACSKRIKDCEGSPGPWDDARLLLPAAVAVAAIVVATNDGPESN